MPLDYLRTIEKASFPLPVDDQHAMRCLDVLKAADLVEATIHEDAEGHYASAVVLRITHQGRAALERLKLQKPPA